jgi:hypothetical protein
MEMRTKQPRVRETAISPQPPEYAKIHPRNPLTPSSITPNPTKSHYQNKNVFARLSFLRLLLLNLYSDFRIPRSAFRLPTSRSRANKNYQTNPFSPPEFNLPPAHFRIPWTTR